jgi:hypothetical protein
MTVSKEKLEEIRNGGKNQDLSGLDLSKTNLRYADLEGANLEGADLKRANLEGVNLERANLKEADLYGAYLRDANLREADLTNANLIHAEFKYAHLNKTKGIISQKNWLDKTFKKGPDFYIVYTILGSSNWCSQFYQYENWEIEKNSFIERECYPYRTRWRDEGICFGLFDWMKEERDTFLPAGNIWECRLYFKDLFDVVVPYATNGYARCSKLQLIKVIDKKD